MTGNQNLNAAGIGDPVADKLVGDRAMALVTETRDEWNSLSESVTEVSRRVATATYAAHLAGLIGEGKPLGTWEAYAGTFSNPVTGKPYTKQQGIAWRRIGQAMALGMSDAHVAQVSSVYGSLGRKFDAATTKTAAGKRLAEVVAASKANKGGNKGASTDGKRKNPTDSTRCDEMETLLAAISTKPSKATRARLAEIRDRIDVMLAPATRSKRTA